MSRINYPSIFIASLSVAIFLLFTNNVSAQELKVDTSSTMINWEEFDLVDEHNKMPPNGWFKLWYIPVAAIPPTVIFLLAWDDDKTILPPTINCLPDQTLSWGQELPSPDPVTVQVTNNCPDGVITVEHIGDISNEGSGCIGDPLIIERTYQASDACDNTVTCIQTFTFAIDDEAPTMTCPVDITLQWSEDIPPPDINAVAVNDNCTPVGEISVTHQSDEDNVGSGCSGDPRIVQRTYTAQDACGNESSCIQTFTFAIDDEAPTMTCPVDITLQWGEDIPPPDINAVTVNDNCTPVGEISVTHQSDEDNGGSGCSGDPRIVQRTYTAQDACGNESSCIQTFTFATDDEAPTMTCPVDITLQWGEDIPPPDINTVTVNDNCTPVGEITVSHQSDEDNGGSGCSGDPRIVQRTYTAQDACGNESSCIQTFTFAIDDEAPTITCPVDLTLECSDDINSANTGEATAVDNCTPESEIVIDSQDDFSGLTGCNATGTIIRTWTATDNCGNISSCTQMLTLEDTTSPVFSDTPTDITVDCGAIPPPFDMGATDNCMFDASPAITFEETTGTGCPYDIIRTWTATDDCGNESTFTQTITVEDNMAPVISCPVDVIVICGETTDPSVTGDPLSNDDCTTTSFTFTDDLSNQTGCSGFIIRTFEVVDECGNVTSCEQIINIVDTGCDFMPNITIDDAECSIPDGEIVIDPIAGYTYTWSNGSTGPVISDLTSGTYTVTIVNDDLSCSQILPITVPQAPPYGLNVLTVNHPSSSGASDGSIELMVSDPNALLPFTILLNGSNYGTASTSTFTIGNLSQGSYIIQIIDANGCPSEVITVELMDSPGFEDPKPEDLWIIDISPASNFTMNWNELHRNTYNMNQVFEDIRAVTGHPPIEYSFQLYYLPDQLRMVSGGILLEEHLLLRFGVGQFSGKAVSAVNEGMVNPFYLESQFQGCQVLGGLRQYFGNQKFRIFTGLDVYWKDLAVEHTNLTLDDQEYTLYDAYSKNDLDFGISNGVQFPIGNNLHVEFEISQIFKTESYDQKPTCNFDLKYRF